MEPIHRICQGGFGCNCASKRYLEASLVHGKRSTYQGGCRCPACRKANNEYQRKYNRRRGYAAAGA